MRRIDGAIWRGALFFTLALACSVPAEAQTNSFDTPEPGPVPTRLRHFEGAVTVQRASAGETSGALVNLPLDAGDRVWTETDGRAELTMADGTTLWLDVRTTLDLVTLEDTLGGDSILRLWAGSMLVWRPSAERLAELRIDVGDSMVLLERPGLSRVDVDDERRVWLSVYDGEAALAAGGIVEAVGAGYTAYTEPGTAPSEASTFSTANLDPFGRWQQQRWLAYADSVRQVGSRSYVPAEVRPYASELSANGSWFYYDDFGAYAWRPTVSVGWSRIATADGCGATADGPGYRGLPGAGRLRTTAGGITCRLMAGSGFRATFTGLPG